MDNIFSLKQLTPSIKIHTFLNMRINYKPFLYLFLLCYSIIHAQYYFGRNKIQYNQFDWQVLTTPHFEIYYYPEEEELAAAGAFFAEESFKELEKKFNFTLIKKVPLIFYSSHIHFQQTNTIPYLIPEGVGGFFEFIKGRVVIPYDGSTYQFKRVIQHELVHVFMHNKIGQILNLHNVQTYRSPPLWFTEGLAEYWSSGWDSKAEMVIRDALINDYFLPLERLESPSTGFLVYKEGQSFLRFIDQVYGPDKILLILNNIWRDVDFYQLLEEILEKDFSEISDEWRYYYKKGIYPTLQDKDTPRMVTTRITKQGINGAPTFYSTSDGDQVIFLTNRTGYSDIYIKRIYQDDTDEKPKLLLHGERTAGLESLHFLQSSIDVNDEGILVFASKYEDRDVLNFFNVENNEIIKIFSHPALVSISSPVWSPNGKKIIFSAIDWRGYSDLYLLETDRMELYQLTNDFYADRQPTFSPDGKKVAFSSDRGDFGDKGFFNLFLLNVENSSISYLTQGSFNDISPDWSLTNPDRIVFTSDRGGNFNIWMLEIQSDSISTTPIPLTQFATGAFDPKWAGNNDQDLLFSAFENYKFQVHLLKDVQTQITLRDERSPQQFDKRRPFWQRFTVPVTKGKSSLPYRRKYTFDIAQTDVAYDPIFGFLGGAQITMSDLLGNDYFHILLYNTAETSSEFLGRINFGLTRVDLSRRINLAYGIFHFAQDYLSYDYGFFFERKYGIRFGLSYPISVFKRTEVTLSAWKTERNLFGYLDYFEAFLVSNSLSYVHDNSIWGPVGPVDGTSFRVTLGQTIDFQRSKFHYYGILTDFRKYYRTSLRTLYALRLMTWYNESRDVLRFYIGGSWGLRGYQRSEVYGQKFILLNNEFRFPFATQLVLRFSSFDIGLTPIRGALFFDIGNAWDNKFDGLLGSLGVGLRGNLLGVIVLRLDVGKRTDFHSFSKGLFTQFFFGWNY